MNCRVEFPVLNSTTTFKVNSTGDVDCNALAANVVNATLGYYHSDHFGNNQSVICDPRRRSVTTFRYGPRASGAMEYLMLVGNVPSGSLHGMGESCFVRI